jgi:hypothetical protein
MRRWSFVLTLAAAASAVGLGACSRLHITPTHGRAYHAVFAIQDANPDRKAPKSIHGLDSQEASIIAGNYRKGLGPKAEGNGAGSSQLLMVAPNHNGGGDATMLAPSVPSGN